jgi:hypothetical protein
MRSPVYYPDIVSPDLKDLLTGAFHALYSFSSSFFLFFLFSSFLFCFLSPFLFTLFLLLTSFFLLAMLQKDPKERISLEEIWRHRWMARIDKLEMTAQDNADIVRVSKLISLSPPSFYGLLFSTSSAAPRCSDADSRSRLLGAHSKHDANSGKVKFRTDFFVFLYAIVFVFVCTYFDK